MCVQDAKSASQDEKLEFTTQKVTFGCTLQYNKVCACITVQYETVSAPVRPGCTVFPPRQMVGMYDTTECTDTHLLVCVRDAQPTSQDEHIEFTTQKVTFGCTCGGG